MKAKSNTESVVTIGFGILFLFFFQLLTDFVESIYAFGLLGTGIPPEIVAVVLFFAPVVLIIIPRWPSTRGLRWMLAAVILARLVEALLPTRSKMLVSGLGVAIFLVLFPGLFHASEGQNKAARLWEMTYGLLLAGIGSIFIRSWNSGVDALTYGSGQWIAWGLATLPLWALWKEWSRNEEMLPKGAHASAEPRLLPAGKTILLCLGMIAVFVLLYYAFIAPNVIVRWTESDYFAVCAVAAFAVALVGLGTLNYFRSGKALPKIGLIVWNALFVLALVLTIRIHQMTFPPTQEAYPLFEAKLPPLHWIPLVVLLLSFPVLFVDFFAFTAELAKAEVSQKALGVGFTLGSVYLLLMVFAHVFTSVYDYIPLVGGYFRDRFWLVHLVAGLILLLASLGVRMTRESRLPAKRSVVLLSVLLSVFSVVGVWMTQAQPAALLPPSERTLRVLTYNIQQGYSEDGVRNYMGQLEVMRSVNADIIGLQESDTNRIANGNADIVRYFADQLNMYAYYGPKTVNGTFGIALLSRYPLQSMRTFYMYSEGEQTATIEAILVLDGAPFNIFVTHLGNGGPIIQQEQVLQVVNGKAHVVLMGDFNFRPGTPQYALTLEMLRDAWSFYWPSGEHPSGIDPQKRIDHVFVSYDLMIQDAGYLVSTASDHPALVVVIRW